MRQFNTEKINNTIMNRQFNTIYLTWKGRILISLLVLLTLKGPANFTTTLILCDTSYYYLYMYISIGISSMLVFIIITNLNSRIAKLDKMLIVCFISCSFFTISQLFIYLLTLYIDVPQSITDILEWISLILVTGLGISGTKAVMGPQMSSNVFYDPNKKGTNLNMMNPFGSQGPAGGNNDPGEGPSNTEVSEGPTYEQAIVLLRSYGSKLFDYTLLYYPKMKDASENIYTDIASCKSKGDNTRARAFALYYEILSNHVALIEQGPGWNLNDPAKNLPYSEGRDIRSLFGSRRTPRSTIDNQVISLAKFTKDKLDVCDSHLNFISTLDGTRSILDKIRHGTDQEVKQAITSLKQQHKIYEGFAKHEWYVNRSDSLRKALNQFDKWNFDEEGTLIKQLREANNGKSIQEVFRNIPAVTKWEPDVD